MKSGTIKLMRGSYSLKTLYYYSVKNRKEIIDRWRKDYGLEFEGLAVQVIPDIDLRAVNADNFKGKRAIKKFGIMPSFNRVAV